MLLFEELVRRGVMAWDAPRSVLTFNLETVGKFPAIRKAKMEEFKWLVGDWACENHVFATPTTPAYTDTYPYTYQLCDDDTRLCLMRAGKEHPYLTFDPFSERWMMTFTNVVFGVLQSPGWDGNSIVFTGRLTMLGVDCELRQTITRRGQDESYILNEERLSDGTWVHVDEFHCHRKPANAAGSA